MTWKLTKVHFESFLWDLLGSCECHTPAWPPGGSISQFTGLFRSLIDSLQGLLRFSQQVLKLWAIIRYTRRIVGIKHPLRSDINSIFWFFTHISASLASSFIIFIAGTWRGTKVWRLQACSKLSAATSVKLLTIFVASDVSISESADVKTSALHTPVHPPVSPTSIQQHFLPQKMNIPIRPHEICVK